MGPARFHLTPASRPGKREDGFAGVSIVGMQGEPSMAPRKHAWEEWKEWDE